MTPMRLEPAASRSRVKNLPLSHCAPVNYYEFTRCMENNVDPNQLAGSIGPVKQKFSV